MNNNEPIFANHCINLSLYSSNHEIIEDHKTILNCLTKKFHLEESNKGEHKL